VYGCVKQPVRGNLRLGTQVPKRKFHSFDMG
jgi:hypothetical protein